MTGLTVLALSVGVLGNVLSRAVVLDAVALWPLAALSVPAALLGLRGGRRLALAPLVLLTWLLVTVGLHLGAVAGLPSAAAGVALDVTGIETGRITVAAPAVSLRARHGDLAVLPVPVGGTAGVPVVERVTAGTATVLTVTDDPDRSPWFRFGAYQLRLPPDVSWDVGLQVASVDLDFRSVRLTSLRVEAATGRVLLGFPAGEALVEVVGDVEVSVPAEAAVTVVGTTRVPAGWSIGADGASAPVGGAGWRIVAEAGSVRIVSR